MSGRRTSLTLDATLGRRNCQTVKPLISSSSAARSLVSPNVLIIVEFRLSASYLQLSKAAVEPTKVYFCPPKV